MPGNEKTYDGFPIPLGHGSYNFAYTNQEYTEVLKVKIGWKGPKGDLDTVERSIRIFKEINPDLEDGVKEFFDNEGRAIGWICPFINGDAPSRLEIRAALIDIFNRTGRVILDAHVKGNFIKNTEGKTVCVDVGMAMEIEKSEEEVFYKKYHKSQRKRTKSIISYNAMEVIFGETSIQHKLLLDSKNIVITTIKALLFIKEHRPDITNANFLLVDTEYINLLANAFDAKYDWGFYSKNSVCDTDKNGFAQRLVLKVEDASGIKRSFKDKDINIKKRYQKKVDKAIEKLNNEKELTFESIKTRCLGELDRYIRSRVGKDGSKDNIRSKLRFFRNNDLTVLKINLAEEIKTRIAECDSIDDLTKTLNLISNRDFTVGDHKYAMAQKSDYTSGLVRCLCICKYTLAKSLELKPDLKRGNQLLV